MKTMLNIKIDTVLKNKARATAEKIGVPLSMVVNQSLRNFVAEKSVTFEEPAPLVPNKKTARMLKQALKDIKEGKNLSPVFKTPGEALAYLHKTAA